MNDPRWGIVLQWHFSGLQCFIWAYHPMCASPMHFATEWEAQEYVDETLEARDDLGVTAEPKQFREGSL